MLVSWIINKVDNQSENLSFFPSIYQEEKNGMKASESKEIKLYAQYPPIEKMDASLSTLTNCEWVQLLQLLALDINRR